MPSDGGASSSSSRQMRHWLGRTALPLHCVSTCMNSMKRASRPFSRMSCTKRDTCTSVTRSSIIALSAKISRSVSAQRMP
jgi:hypothetical protein